MLIQLFDHYAWADARVAAALTAAHDSAERRRAIELYGHAAAAAETWLARIQARTPTRALWAPIELQAAIALSRDSLDGLRAVARESDVLVGRQVSYTNSSGASFRNTLSDCLLQAALHGVHHRAQINLLLRAAGETPPAIDYIAFVRERDATAR